jgi:hypothetical protein
MFLIGLNQSTADAKIGLIALQLPVGMSIGRILAVTPSAVLTDDGIWGTRADHGHSWRMVQLSDTSWEMTRWRAGHEIGRAIVSASA